jgi:hypothetical protein
VAEAEVAEAEAKVDESAAKKRFQLRRR